MECLLEICAASPQSALNAEKGGADRIELCDNLWEGGTTPSLATIQLIKKSINIPVFVLIRPRGGDFVYNDLEFEIMKRDIELCKEHGIDGVVSGILLRDGKVDIERTTELVKASDSMEFTFHRAFDLTPDPFAALEDIIQCGANRILTSGQKNTADEGSELIARLISKAGKRLRILAGGGINENNVHTLVETGCAEFHLTAKSMKKRSSDYPIKVAMNSSADISEDHVWVSDIEKIKQIRKLLDEAR